MKREIFYTKRFKKDLKRFRNDPKRQQAIVQVVKMLSYGEELPIHMRPHPLKGNYAGHMELHIEGDLLLIWREVSSDGIEIIFLVRVGSHSELF